MYLNKDMWDMYFMLWLPWLVFYYCIVKCFNSRKILKAYCGFRVLYVFPFPTIGHWPLVSGHDKVGIRALIAIVELGLLFCVFFSLLRLLGWKLSLLYPCSSILRLVSILLFELCPLSFQNEEKNSEHSCC